MLAVEKDYALAEKLEGDFADISAFRVVQGDILRLNIGQCIMDAKSLYGACAPERIKVVANLPYYITTDLLKQLLSQGDSIESLSLLLQDEVAQRLTCQHPGATSLLLFTTLAIPIAARLQAVLSTCYDSPCSSADVGAYRPMTVFTHFYGEPKYVFKIDRSCFYPVPNVHGALATFSLLTSPEWPPVRDEREFLVFVRQAFLSKRKMLTNSLQPMWSRETVAAALQELGVSDQVCSIFGCGCKEPLLARCL